MPPQRRSLSRALVALNLTLAGTLTALTLLPTQTVSAQPGAAPARPRGDYAMVSGKSSGIGNYNAVFIVDSTNQELVALKWDNSRTQFDGLGFRSLNADRDGQTRR
jgi:hypothetical protein